MKKTLIAGAASAVLAAMPVMGVFAVETGTVTDTVKLTVNKTCKMEAAATSAEYNLGAQAGGAYAAVSGSPMTITCNAASGWNLKATPSALTSSTTDQTIPFGAYGTTTSVWSAIVELDGNNTANAEVVNGFDDWTATATDGATQTIVTQNLSDTSGALPAAGLIIRPSYKAYVAADQAQGLYSGTILYTFTDLTPAPDPDPEP